MNTCRATTPFTPLTLFALLALAASCVVLNPEFDSGYGDVWAFDVAVGDQVFARADTVASETASDLFLVIFKQLESPRASRFIRSDDQFDCTYPPPDFQCPEAEAEVPADAPENQVGLLINSLARSTRAYGLRYAVDFSTLLQLHGPLRDYG